MVKKERICKMKIFAYMTIENEVELLFTVYSKCFCCINKKVFFSGHRNSYILNNKLVDGFNVFTEIKDFFHKLHVEHGNYIYFSKYKLNERQRKELENHIKSIKNTNKCYF